MSQITTVWEQTLPRYSQNRAVNMLHIRRGDTGKSQMPRSLDISSLGKDQIGANNRDTISLFHMSIIQVVLRGLSNHFFMFLFVVCLGPHLKVLRADYWLCTQSSLLVGLRRPSEMLGLNLG